jgi:hypothetical protein
MKIAVISVIKKSGVIKYSDSVPRVGESVQMFYTPMPKVTDVVWWPNDSDLKVLMMNSAESADVDVIVFVE